MARQNRSEVLKHVISDKWCFLFGENRENKKEEEENDDNSNKDKDEDNKDMDNMDKYNKDNKDNKDNMEKVLGMASPLPSGQRIWSHTHFKQKSLRMF